MTATDIDALIERLEKLHDSTTRPFPWLLWTSNSHRRIGSATGKPDDVAYGVIHKDGCDDIVADERNLEYMVEAANALPALATSLRTAQHKLAQAEGEISHIKECNRIVKEEYQAAQAENARMREALTWQPIETAPKDGGGDILLYSETWSDTFGDRQIGYWGDDGWVFASGMVIDPPDEFGDFEPTHWQPLPSPPETSKSK